MAMRVDIGRVRYVLQLRFPVQEMNHRRYAVLFFVWSTVFYMQTLLHRREREQQRFDDYEAYRSERLYTDEVTDATERINAPMGNSFEYTYQSDEELYFQGQSLAEVFETGVKKAQLIAESRPDFMVEYVRRRLEYDEYEHMKRLAAGNDDDPDCMMVISPIPDAVMSGLDLGAYDLNRKKVMIRVFERTGEGMHATSLSLDGSDRDGLRSIAGLFGETISDEETSEEILARRFVGWGWQFDHRLKHVVRETYDDVLRQKHGGKWFAGQRDPVVSDAREFIEIQADLLANHMERIQAIMVQPDTDARRTQLNDARYDFAAALTRRMNGEHGSIDLADAGGAAREAGESYDNDCPDGGVTARQSTEQLGFGEKVMACPFCGLATKGDPCASRLVCQKCAAEVSSGKVVSRGIGRENALTLLETKQAVFKEREQEQAAVGRLEFAKVLYGDDVEVKYELCLGGADYIVYDCLSGQKIGKV